MPKHTTKRRKRAPKKTGLKKSMPKQGSYTKGILPVGKGMKKRAINSARYAKRGK